MLYLAASALQAAVRNQHVSDKAIAEAVDRELMFEKGVSPNFVDVECSGGVVTLSGSVDNLLAKERAVTIAETVRYVQAVIDRLRVTPLSRPDADIRKDVLMALLQDAATEPDSIQVSVTNAVVTLSGSVGSWAESHIAERLAKRVKGSKLVLNDLAMNYQTERADEEITADIRSILPWDIWLNGELINVSVNHGHVALSGAVGSLFAKRRAVEDAWVDGVKSVSDSEVRVDPSLRDKARRKFRFVTKTDSEIQKAVQAALRHDPRVAPFAFNVRVEDNAVVLSGSVSNLKAKLAAERDARNTIGVWWVTNLLKVRPVKPPSDADIEKNLSAALALDSLLSNTAIQAAVVDHIAYLSGVVNDRFQKEEAQEITSRINGIVEIRNRLLIQPGYTAAEYNSYYNWPEYYGGPFYNQSWLSATVPLPTDQQIKRAVEKEFFWSPFVRSGEIKVRVHHGVVILTGTVDGYIAYREVARDAAKSGAVAVVNHLRVTKGAWF